MNTTEHAENPNFCAACNAYVAHYPLMADEWECEHGGDEQAFMLAMADAIHGPSPQGEMSDPGWRAAQFLQDAEVALDCGHAPYEMQITYNVEPWSFMALVNSRHLIGTRNGENEELEHIADVGWITALSPSPSSTIPPQASDRREDHAWPCPFFYSGNWDRGNRRASSQPCTCPPPVSANEFPAPAQDVSDRLALGEVLARVDEHDYCHERIREWEAQEQWEKDAHPDEAPSADLEDAEWWNRRADAALAWFVTYQQSPQAALNEVRADALEDAANHWSEWEAFTASDGVVSLRQHGRSPQQILRARAAELRAAPQDGGERG